MPIIEDMKKRRRFNEYSQFTIGEPERHESLSLMMKVDNIRNTTSAVVLFENLELSIENELVRLDFQVDLKLERGNQISVYDLELILIPQSFLERYQETNIIKEIISCWNDNAISSQA